MTFVHVLSLFRLLLLGLFLAPQATASTTEGERELQQLGLALKDEVSFEVNEAAVRLGLLRGVKGKGWKRPRPIAKALVQKEDLTVVTHHRFRQQEQEQEQEQTAEHDAVLVKTSSFMNAGMSMEAREKAGAVAVSELEETRRDVEKLIRMNDQLRKDIQRDQQRARKLEGELQKQTRTGSLEAANRALDAVMQGYESQDSVKTAKKVVEAYEDPMQEMLETAKEKEQGLKNETAQIKMEQTEAVKKANEMGRESNRVLEKRRSLVHEAAQERAQLIKKNQQFAQLQVNARSVQGEVAVLSGTEEVLEELHEELSESSSEVNQLKKNTTKGEAKAKELLGALLQQDKQLTATKAATHRVEVAAQKSWTLMTHIRDLQEELQTTAQETKQQASLLEELKQKRIILERAASKEADLSLGARRDDERWKAEAEGLQLQVVDVQRNMDRLHDQANQDMEKAKEDDAGMDTYFDEDASTSEKVQSLEKQVVASYATSNQTEDKAAALRLIVSNLETKLQGKQAETHSVWVQAQKAISELKFRLDLDHGAERELQMTLAQIEGALNDDQRKALGLPLKMKKANGPFVPAAGLDQLFHPGRHQHLKA